MIDLLDVEISALKKTNLEKLELHFALGKAYEDMKNFEESFSFYQEANLINRKKISFSMKDEKSKFDEIKNIYILLSIKFGYVFTILCIML